VIYESDSRDLSLPPLAQHRWPTSLRSEDGLIALVSVGHRRRDDLDHRNTRLGPQPAARPEGCFLRPDLRGTLPGSHDAGDATIATVNDAATVEEIRAITRRYIVPEEVEGYIARWPDLRTTVTIVPAHIVSWSAGG